MWDEIKAFNRKKVLVTGGLGFIGSTLVRRLVELGAEVTVVDALIPDSGGNLFNVADVKERIELIIADVRDEAVAGRCVRGQDYLFNLVGQVSHIDSMHNPYIDLESNCRTHLAILEACRKHSPEVKIVFAGTRQQYGRPDYLPVDEEHPLHPRDINGIHKMTAEYYHLLYNRVYGIRTVSLRLTNTYGPRQLMRHDRQGFVYWFIRQAIDGETLRIFGDGSQLRDFTYVDDVVEAFLLAALSAEANGKVFNLGGEKPFSLLEFVRTLFEVCGGGSYTLVPFPEERCRIDIGSFYADYSKITRVLGWIPRVPLREGLRRTVAFYTSNKRHYWA